MSEIIKQATPSAEQQGQMAEYANLIGEAMEYVTKYVVDMDLQYSMKALHEAMFWFHSYIMKGGKLMPPMAKEESKEAVTVN